MPTLTMSSGKSSGASWSSIFTTATGTPSLPSLTRVPRLDTSFLRTDPATGRSLSRMTTHATRSGSHSLFPETALPSISSSLWNGKKAEISSTAVSTAFSASTYKPSTSGALPVSPLSIGTPPGGTFTSSPLTRLSQEKKPWEK